MPLDFSTVPAEARQQMLNEGLITPDNELTGLGTLSANLAGTNLQNAQKQAIVAQFNQGFINPDFSFTETGRLQFMDKDTALFEGKDTFRKWYRQGGWERYKNDKPNDPLHVAVGKAVDAIATETLPQAAQGVALGAASSLGLGKFVSWLTQQPLAKYAPGPLGQAAQAVQSAQKAGAPVPTGQELQDQLDKMAGVAGGNFLKELARNQALMDKGAKLVWAKWGTDMTQDDTEEIDALYEFEKAQYLINEIDAAEAVAAVTALAHVVDPDDPASQEQMLEATQRARAGVELARSELTPEAAEFAEKAGGSAGEIFDPTLIAPTFGGFGVRGIIAGAGRSTAKRITKIADDIAEKKALRETAQNALANANATEILGRVGVDRAALRKSVQELTTEIDELNNLAAKLTDRGYRGGVGRRALDSVRDLTAAGAKKLSETRAGGVGRAIDNYFTAPRTLPGHARNLAIAGTAAGAAVSAEQLAAASGVPGLQLGSNIAKGVAALALAPHLYRNAKTLARSTHALGAEFVARRSTLPYWRGVSKRMADNKLISGAAVTMDMFAKPLVPVRNVGKRAAQATLAEMPFSYIASGGQDGWFAEAIAEGLIFGAPGQVQGLIHSMGGMPAVMKKEYFDQLANNDAAELRRTLPKRHRQALDNFRPEIRRMIGSYSAMFPDLEFRFQPAPGDLSGSGYDKYTNTVYIDPNTRRPLDALLAHEVAHSIQERGLDADIIDDLVGPNGLLRNEDGSLVEGARKFKAQYEKDLGRPISDETLAREWFAESAAPGLMRRQSLQKLVRRNPITRRLAESILPETSLGRQLLLRNGVLLDRNGRPVKGQGAMGAIVEGSPAMARIVDRYLRATAGDLPAADPTKAVEKAKDRPLTPEEQENANRNNLLDFETNADGSQKKVNGRRVPVQPKTLKLQRITIGEEIEAFADELTFADAARMPEKLSLAEKINRFNEQDWEKLVDRLESAGIYNSSQIAMFREIFRRRAIGDSLSLKFNYQPAITTRNNRKKYDSRERELYTGAVYQVRITKAKNVVLDIIDMDFLEQRAMKAAQTKLGQKLYPDGTAAIMRDVMTLAENHVNGNPNSAVFTKPNQLNFLNGVLGRLSMEHKAKNPMASGRPAVRSLRLDRINQIAPTQQKGLPFIPERWRDNLMPEPADERFFGETEPVVSMENMPGMNTGVLQNLHAATPKQRQGFEESILETISDPEFGDVFGRAIDTRVKLAPLAPSVYVNTEGGIEINAAQQVGGFRSREDAELYALLRGLFMKQEAVAGNLPNPGGEMTAADFFVGTALDEAGVKKVMTGIINALDEAGLGPAAAEDFAFYGNPEGFSLVHLGFNEAVTPQIRTDVFADQVELLGTPNYKEYASDTFYLDNNWKTTDVVTEYGEVKRASPSGEAYAAEIAARSRSTGRPDLLAGLADRVGARLQGVYDSFAAREFGEPGRQLGGPGTEGFTLTGRPLSEVQRAPEGDIRRMPEGQARAKSGGEYGPNGEWYPGGAFIATTQLPKRAREKLKRLATGREQVRRGVGRDKYEVPPPGQIPVLRYLDFFDPETGDINLQAVEFHGHSQEMSRQLEGAGKRFAAGEVYAPASEFPLLANYSDIARLIENNYPVSPEMLGKMPDEARKQLEQAMLNPGSDDIRRISDDDIRRMPEAADGSTPRMGVNINDATQAFTDQILAGEKTIETRDSNSLDPYLNQKVGLVRTGQGTATLVGYADIVGVKKYTSEAEFRKDQDAHLVEPGSKYDWTPKGKVGYVLANPEAVEPHELSSRGIVARDIRRMPEQLDADYKQAIEKGTDAEARAVVTAAAQRAGFLPAIVYRGDIEPFNVFDKRRRGEFTKAPAAKLAFYFSDDFSVGALYRDSSVEHYNDLEKKAEIRALKAEEDRLIRALAKFPETVELARRMNAGTGEKGIKMALGLDDELVSIWQESLSGESAKINDRRLALQEEIVSLQLGPNPNATKREGVVRRFYVKMQNPKRIDQSKRDRSEAQVLRANDITQALKEGHDGVIFENDPGHNDSDVYAVFEPEQIKNAALITYDDQGNLIPLSERFNPESDDIRRMPEDPTALPIVEARNKDGSVKKKDNKVVYETVGYDLLHAPALEQQAPPPQDTTKPDYDSLHYHVTKKDRERIDELIDSGAVDAAAADLEADARQAMDIPEIASGIGWYSRMRKKLRIALAGDHELFADLLGATSANTDVEQNFIYAFDAYRQFKAGKFDKMLRRFQEAVDLADSGKLRDTMIARRIIGKGQSKRMDQQALLKKWIERYNLEPRRADGAKYGMNSAHVFRALSGQFTQVRGPRAKDKLSPKTPQFSMNLFGSSLSATIDVWAARYLRRRLYSGQVKQWRIQPKSETGVSNADFLLGQEIFRRAADKLGMSPDDLQALMWFKEKDVWDQAGWTKGAGAIKTSFDQAADAFFPPGQKMSASQLAQANRRGLSSLNFIRKHRAVENAATKLEALAGQTGRKVTTAKRNLRNARKELTKARKRAGVAEFLERNPELN